MITVSMKNILAVQFKLGQNEAEVLAFADSLRPVFAMPIITDEGYGDPSIGLKLMVNEYNQEYDRGVYKTPLEDGTWIIDVNGEMRMMDDNKFHTLFTVDPT